MCIQIQLIILLELEENLILIMLIFNCQLVDSNLNLSSTRKLLDESYSNDSSYQLVCKTYNNSQNSTNNVSSASQQVFAIPNQSVQVLSQPTQTKSLLKPIGRNTNQVAITTKSRGRPPLSILRKNLDVQQKEKLLNKLKKIVSDQ
jgi:hypothetical protein